MLLNHRKMRPTRLLYRKFLTFAGFNWLRVSECNPDIPLSWQIAGKSSAKRLCFLKNRCATSLTSRSQRTAALCWI